MQNRHYGKFHLTLFSSAIQTHMDLKLVRLADCPEYLDEAAQWVFDQWYYLEDFSLEDFKQDLDEDKNDLFILIYGQNPVGMFGLYDIDIPKWATKINNNYYLFEVYVEEKLRGLGLGHFILSEAKRIALHGSLDILQLEILNTNLNKFYKKLGAVEVCESQSQITLLRF